MKRWVVTGPIGSGKSVVTAVLAGHGAAVLDGDRLGHEILARPEIAARIAARFGADTVRDGVVDRRRLGELVFAAPEALAALDAITAEPLARLFAARLDDLERAGDHALAVLEAAVYFQLPTPPPVDLVVAVVAAADVRERRLVAQRSLTPEAARRRIAAQARWEPLWRRADVIINNDGTPAELGRAADELVRRHLRTER